MVVNAAVFYGQLLDQHITRVWSCVQVDLNMSHSGEGRGEGITSRAAYGAEEVLRAPWLTSLLALLSLSPLSFLHAFSLPCFLSLFLTLSHMPLVFNLYSLSSSLSPSPFPFSTSHSSDNSKAAKRNRRDSFEDVCAPLASLKLITGLPGQTLFFVFIKQCSRFPQTSLASLGTREYKFILQFAHSFCPTDQFFSAVSVQHPQFRAHLPSFDVLVETFLCSLAHSVFISAFYAHACFFVFF